MSKIAKLFRKIANGEETEIPWDLILSSQKKKKCLHVFEHTGVEHACIYCGLIPNVTVFVLNTSELIDFWPRSYARKQYFDAMFTKLNGMEKPYLPLDFQLEFIKTIENPGDWYQVYHAYRDYGLKDWWTGWNFLRPNSNAFGLKPIHHSLLLYIDARWDHAERIKKKINVFYCLYKIVQLQEDPVDWVPMKLRTIALTRLDEEWNLICKKFNWKFIPTEKKLTKFNW